MVGGPAATVTYGLLLPRDRLLAHPFARGRVGQRISDSIAPSPRNASDTLATHTALTRPPWRTRRCFERRREPWSRRPSWRRRRARRPLSIPPGGTRPPSP